MSDLVPLEPQEVSWPQVYRFVRKHSEPIGLAILILNWALWFLGFLPTPLALVLGGAGGILTLIGIIGHVVVSNNQRLVTLGSLAPEGAASSKRKVRPRTNLALLGTRHGQFYVDEQHRFWEIRVPGTEDSDPLYCAALLFSNEPIANQAGQIITNLRARLRFTGNDREDVALIDRGSWVREEYNFIDLGVGDSRLLIIAWGLSPNEARDDYRFGFAMQNNHYSVDNYHGPAMWQLDDNDAVSVNVQLVAGNGGYLMYEETFTLQIYPYLKLTGSAL